MKGYEPAGYFVLRTPLLPFADIQSPLTDVCSRPEVREAIFLASPTLEAAMDPADAAVNRSLQRYVSRMCSRPTPFGLFAGCSVGRLDDHTNLELAPLASYRRQSRFDMDYLDALARTMADDPQVRRDLTYRPNTSLHLAQGRWRFAQSRIDGKIRTHHLLAADDNWHLQTVIEQSRDGASLEDLVKVLVSDRLTAPVAEAYVAEIVQSQILTPDLTVNLTGAPAVDGLLGKLEGLPEGRALRAADDELSAIDSDGVGGSSPSRYRDLATALGALPVDVDLSRVFQVDMVKPAPRATLGHEVAAEMLRGAELVRSWFPAPSNHELDAFIAAFSARFEHGEVPLLEAVDDQLGVGFGSSEAGSGASPLLAGLALPSRPDRTVEWGPVQTFLLRRLASAIAAGSAEIALSPGDLPHDVDDGLPFADAFSVHGCVSAASEEDLLKGNFLVRVTGFSGVSGAEMFGRFCHADPALLAHVEAQLREEESREPDVVFAEIVHLPEGRTGNILSRPALREHEIVYLGGSGAAIDGQIPASDLQISVRAGEVVLRSRRLGRRVIPRMTNAHNFQRRSIGIYRMLCLLQSQGVHAGAGWDWGPLATAPFLPRVRAGRVVLSLAQWHLDRSDIAGLVADVPGWRAERSMPRFVAVVDGDNLLTIDLDNPLSVDSFVRLVKARDSVTLRESWADDLVAHGPEGRFTHELIVPFRRTEVPQRSAPPADVVGGGKRSFPPGSEWLYAKIYSGKATADGLLLDVVRPVARRALGSDAADTWFFIRYGDPEPHLRVRFHGDPDRLRSEVLPDLHAALARDARAWRVQLDTYEQELESYGGRPGIAIAEQIFQIDSEAVLDILGMLDGDTGADERWRLALAGTAMILTDLGLTPAEQLAFCQRRRDSFALEFHADRTVKKQLGERFRNERAVLELLLDPPFDGEHRLSLGFDVLHRRSEQLAPLIVQLGELELSTSMQQLAERYAHMHVNRLVRTAQRAHELVLYDYLARLLLSASKR